VALARRMDEAAASAASDSARRGTRTLVWRLASVGLFCTTWEIAGRIPVNLAFPPFSEVALAFAAMLADGSLPRAFLVTLQPLVLGVGLSAVLGVVLGVAMGLRPGIEWLGAPVFIVLQAAPVAALVPLVTFVYGIGLASKVIVVMLLALPVIVLNGYKAVRNVNPSLVAMCRSFQGTPAQVVLKVVLPDASPVIFAGLRLGVSAGFIGVVLAELLITPTGVGDLITYHRAVAEYAHMYAVIAFVIVFSAVTLAGLQRLEIALFRPEKRTA